MFIILIKHKIQLMCQNAYYEKDLNIFNIYFQIKIYFFEALN